MVSSDATSLARANPHGSVGRGRRYYLLQTKPRNEQRVIANLEQARIACAFPLVLVARIAGGRLIKKREPLFPRYIFAFLDLEQEYYLVKNTRGVNRFISFGSGGPVPVSADIVSTFVAPKAQGGSHDGIPTISALPAAGATVAIKSGAFRGAEAVFQCVKGEDRATVLIWLLNQRHSVEIELASLEC